jgi:Domain of unknown function (DUF4365)
MPPRLPTSSERDQTGRHGVTILQERLEREGWVFRRQDGNADFGIDGEIEIVDRNRVTGRLVKCQVKASAGIAFKDGETSVQVKVSTYNLWRDTPLPTILFHIDTETRAIYWTPALAHHPKRGAQSLSIRFEESSELGDGLGTLRAYLDTWFVARGGGAILHEIPAFNRIYRKLLEVVDGYDDWTEMNEQEDEAFRLFYGHALRLRLEVGLSNVELPTFDEWHMRNQGIWDNVYPLHWGTFNEAMKIISPAYEEAFNRVVARTEAELTVENQIIWSFIEQHKQGGGPHYSMLDDRARDARFHARLEAKLKAAGALKYRFADQQKPE